MKRTITALLLLTMLLSMFASCGGDSGTSGTVDTTTPEAGETTVAETEDPLADSLPDKDFDGKVFRMYARKFESTDEVKFAFAEAENGDIINDAVFQANKNVEDRFNVDITMTGYETQINTANNSIGNSILAGDDIFDVFSSHDRTMAQFSLAGLLTDVNLLDHLDYSKPWWPKNTLDTLTINGVMYLISNSMSYANIRGASMVYMNKARMEDFGIELPYQTVLDGNWTFDFMSSIVKDIYLDVNGDNARDDGDFYGFVGDVAAYRITESFDIQTYAPDDELIIKIEPNNEKTISLIEKYYELAFNSKGGLMKFDAKNPREMFMTDNVLMYFGTLGNSVEYLRYSEIEYGFLPMPKLDEHQDDYITGANDVPYGVPVTNNDLDFTGFMIEAMSAEGHRTILPAYFEVALKQKFASDEESIQMLDIIAAGRVIDFGYLYCGDNKLCRPITNLLNLSNPSKDYASFYAANIAAEQANVDMIIEAFLANQK